MSVSAGTRAAEPLSSRGGGGAVGAGIGTCIGVGAVRRRRGPRRGARHIVVLCMLIQAPLSSLRGSFWAEWIVGLILKRRQSHKTLEPAFGTQRLLFPLIVWRFYANRSRATRLTAYHIGLSSNCLLKQKSQVLTCRLLLPCNTFDNKNRMSTEALWTAPWRRRRASFRDCAA